MEQKLKTVVIVYEVEQITVALSYLEREKISLDACTIIPLEFEVERALRARGVPFESLLKYVPLEEEFADVLDSARGSARRFHEHAAMQFYAYCGINIGTAFEPMIDMYMEHLGRYINIFSYIDETKEIKKLLIPYSTRKLSASLAALVPFEFISPVDAAKSVGRNNGFEVVTVGKPAVMPYIRMTNTIWKTISIIGLCIYNECIRLCVRPKLLKLYASEYWSHIESFITKMDDVELVLMERSEIKNIPWRQLLKHRIRFLHPSDAICSNTKRRITRAVDEFSRQWQANKNEVREVFNGAFRVDAWPEIERALTYLVEIQTARTLIDIEGLLHVMKKESPDKVLLRASIGGASHHFFIATQIAHQLWIPSIELQHAGAVIDPRSVHSRLTASYLAAYGPVLRDLYQKNHGYAPERIRSIGSPRFDHYVRERDNLARDHRQCLTKFGLNPSLPTVFIAVPFPGPYPLLSSSYQVADFFKTLRVMQKQISGLQFIFKFRPGSLLRCYQDYIEELFTEGGIVCTDTKSYLSLILASYSVCTGRSTLMHESMLAGRSVILFPWLKWDTYTLGLFGRALPVALNETELLALLRRLLDKGEAEKQVNKQNEFLAENYSFDGHAPERIMALLREKLLPLP